MGYNWNPKTLEYFAKKDKAKADLESRNSGLAEANLFSNLGDVIAGKNVGSGNKVFDGIRERNKAETVGQVDDDFKAERENYAFDNQQKEQGRKDALHDPNSQQSIAFRKAMESVAPSIAKHYGDDWKNVTAADQDLIFKPVQFKESQETRRQAAALAAQTRGDSLAAKKAEKDDKKKQSMNEIEDRRQNINSAIDTLTKQIDNYGTFEMIGPENQNMERLIDQVATDMAKLMDPNSVARPNEVELVKQGLVQSGFKNSNKTAKKILADFKNEVKRRADSAYKIRGLEAPAGSEPETKIIQGKTYKKVQGGWEEI